jgi:hypothetical protein
VQPHLQEQVRAQHPPHPALRGHRCLRSSLDRLRLRLGLWLRHLRCLHSACPGISGALRGSAIVLQGGDTMRLRQVAQRIAQLAWSGIAAAPQRAQVEGQGRPLSCDAAV